MQGSRRHDKTRGSLNPLFWTSTRKPRLQIKRGPVSPALTVQFQQKFQNFKKKLRYDIRIPNNGESLLTRNAGLLRRRTTHGGWRNGSTWRTSSLLGLRSHLTNGNLEKDWKKLEALWVLKKAQDLLIFRRGSDWERWTVKWIDCWKTRVFYRLPNGRDMRRISRA